MLEHACHLTHYAIGWNNYSKLNTTNSGTINAIVEKVDIADYISDCIEGVVQQLEITPDSHSIDL